MVKKEIKKSVVGNPGLNPADIHHDNYELFRNAFRYSAIGMALVSIDGQWLQVNPNLNQILGYTEEELLQMTFQEITHPDDLDSSLGFIKQMLDETIESYTLEKRYFHKNGNIVWCFLAVSLAKTNQGLPLYFITQIEDITERKRTEQLLMQSQLNFETFFNQTDDLVLILNENGQIIHTNLTLTMRLGYSKALLSGRPVLNIFTKEHHDCIKKIIAEIAMKQDVLLNASVVTKNGIHIPVETKFTKGYWDNNPAIIGIVKDISALLLSEEKFKKVFCINPSACVLTDLDTGRYLEVNDAFCSLFGYTAEEAIGKTALELGIMTSEIRNSVKKTEDPNGRVSGSECNLITKSGDIRCVILTTEIIYIKDKKYRYTVVNDFTDRKKSEAELKNSVEQLRLLTQHIEKIREDERLAISRDLHDDLGQALTAINIDLGIIKQYLPNEDAKSKMTRVSKMVSETIQTVQRLTMQLRPDIINDLGIENAIEWYTRDFSLRNDVKFLIDVDYDTPISYESSLVIFRIMQESLTNISRHSSATEVGIKLYKNPENIIFRIHDNGIGISDLQQKSRRSFGIIGMKERAASIGGILEITRGKTGGTDCILRIPLHKSRKNENSDLRRS